ncbi:MAG: 16S rRNA (cytosine(1402)-N(4))-methyltransferase [Gammaproteobacteria bacterium HGW-Gammaproteobacteria-3]|nr:MAG: 16S rRNA (cytosine(1402)-N(4))-methyltransferase [Gammaproteobacteria bacterium HGW-Gammaproteobacteria-3]
MKRISLVQEAHAIVRQYLQPGHNAIDATVGNGHDTLFLAQQVGPKGHVYGFDIQPQALASARLKLNQHNLDARVTLINESHARLAELVPQHAHARIQAVMFNLGFLPGSDKTVITQTESTLAALNAALRVLAFPGIITLIAYPGHVGGAEEACKVETWCGQQYLQRFSLRRIDSVQADSASPRLFVIEKTRELNAAAQVRTEMTWRAGKFR